MLRANEDAKSLYKQLLRASRQWRDLKNRMEQGLGHQPEESIQDGSMAVFCPACPQPGVNLPMDWNTRYERYVIPPDLAAFIRPTIDCLEGMNLFVHSSWMATSLQST
jgi:hypothetical protein